MAYAMYLRKSRADEELGYENTLERHEEMLRNLAAQTGIHVDESHIYREIVSGESIEESEERHAKAVPILTRVVEEMHTLEPKEQNDLLKMIVDRIEYEKTESGAAIEPTLRISLKI